MQTDQKNPVAALTSYVTFRLARTQNKLNAQAMRLLKQGSNLSLVEWRIIVLLRLSDGASMSKLSADVQMDKGQLSRKVSSMTQKGLLFATPDDADSRLQHLHLTREALDIATRMAPIMLERQQMLLRDVDAGDLEVFFNVLSKIDAASENRKAD